MFLTALQRVQQTYLHYDETSSTPRMFNTVVTSHIYYREFATWPVLLKIYLVNINNTELTQQLMNVLSLDFKQMLLLQGHINYSKAYTNQVCQL